MSKFLQLIENSDPSYPNAINAATLAIINALGDKFGSGGVIYRHGGIIDVTTKDNQRFCVKISKVKEEEAEQVATEDDIDNDVERLAGKAKKPGSAPNSKVADAAVKQRSNIQNAAINSFKTRTAKLQKALQQSSRTI